MAFQFYILPGGDGTNDYGWFDWLKKVLERQGHEVYLCEERVLSPEKRALMLLKKHPLTQNTIIVGHSFGALTALKWVEMAEKNIQGLILADPSVRAAFLLPWDKDEDQRIHYLESWDWHMNLEKVRSKIQQCIILSDEKLCAGNSKREDALKEYAERLHAHYISLKPEKQHFCSDREWAVIDAIYEVIEDTGDTSTLKDIDLYAKTIWEYMHMHHKLRPMDAIFALGSNDLSVAKRAAELYLQGYGRYVICAGGNGKESQFLRPEGEIFAEEVIAQGVPREKVIIENKSSNTGENILFVKKLLQEQGLDLTSFILVQKPYMERRTYATFRKQWPGAECLVTSPTISFERYWKDHILSRGYIKVMVGDLLRIKEFPKQGFQIEQDIPVEVWNAGQKLLQFGFDKYAL